MSDATAQGPATLLITLTGTDRPGVTSTVLQALARGGVEVLDVEQIVLRRRAAGDARRGRPGRR
jgi:phosphoserine phosphatase